MVDSDYVQKCRKTAIQQLSGKKISLEEKIALATVHLDGDPDGDPEKNLNGLEPDNAQFRFYLGSLYCQKGVDEQGMVTNISFCEKGLDEFAKINPNEPEREMANEYVQAVYLALARKSIDDMKKRVYYIRAGNAPEARLWRSVFYGKNKEWYAAETQMVQYLAQRSLEECCLVPLAKAKSERYISSPEKGMDLFGENERYWGNILLGLYYVTDEKIECAVVGFEKALQQIGCLSEDANTSEEKKRILETDRDYVHKGLLHLYLAVGRKSDPSGRAVMGKKIVEIDQNSLEGNLWLGDDAYSRGDWEMVYTHYDVLYKEYKESSNLVRENVEFSTSLFMDLGRMTVYLFALYKKGVGFSISCPIAGCKDKVLFTFIQQLSVARAEKVDLSSSQRRISYFHFDPLAVQSADTFYKNVQQEISQLIRLRKMGK